MSNAKTNSDGKQELVLELEESKSSLASSGSLLDGLIASTLPAPSAFRAAQVQASSNRYSLEEFLGEKNTSTKLAMWFGETFLEKQADEKWRTVARRIQADIAKIDDLLNRQTNQILHHPDFQKLEASWRGVEYLTRCLEAAGDAPIRVRVLNVSWNELCKDFDRALETDQSQLFQKVYEEELGTPGGIPFSVLLADYDIHPRPSREHPHDDIAMLKSLSRVGAASFCPIILNAAPEMLSLSNFSEMQPSIDFSKIQQDLTFLSWRQFRETEDARFIGLVMPRILMRDRYPDTTDRHDGFPYHESIRTSQDQLWGGACFAIGETLIRCFAENRWLADIRGVKRGFTGGGIVHGAAREEFHTDSAGIVLKPFTELMIGDSLETHLVELGFVPLCHCKDSGVAAFYSTPSTQKPKTYHDLSANTNSKMSAMLNYMFCVSRFAHYLKVMGRDKIGMFKEPEDIQYELSNWLHGYVTSDSNADERIKSRYPLREAEIRVIATPGKAGSYEIMMKLSPHFELEEMQASIQLRTELVRR